MPIINISALPQKENVDISAALKETFLRVAEVFSLEPHQVWANYQEIKPGHYVEGNTEAHIQPVGTHPPIVELIAFEGRDNNIIEKALITVAETLTKSLEIPENIFLTYKEASSGKVYTGGSLRYKK